VNAFPVRHLIWSDKLGTSGNLDNARQLTNYRKPQ
jgi:hypothetical protein